MISDGDTIFLGSGTTIVQVAKALQNHQNLTVITNSLLVMDVLRNAPGIQLVGLGGVLRRSEQSFIGHITELALSELRVDTVIMGIHAIDVEEGLTNDYLPETQTDRAILKIGQRVIIVADHTKCGRVSTAFVAPLTAITTLLTDDKVPPQFVSEVAAQGIQVLTV
jgi:DeoR/GlpR family transcriptional regulator of sugar metabolism